MGGRGGFEHLTAGITCILLAVVVCGVQKHPACIDSTPQPGLAVAHSWVVVSCAGAALRHHNYDRRVTSPSPVLPHSQLLTLYVADLADDAVIGQVVENEVLLGLLVTWKIT
jgi:hypothetical protein